MTKAYLMVGKRFQVDGEGDDALNNLNGILDQYKLVIPDWGAIRVSDFAVRRKTDAKNTRRYSIIPTYGDDSFSDVCIGKSLGDDGSGAAEESEADIHKAFIEVRQDIPECRVLVFHDSYRER